MKHATSNKSIILLSCSWITLSLFLTFVVLIWEPEIMHYYVSSKTISVGLIEQGRRNPSDAVLEEIRSHRLLEREWQSEAQMIGTAEKLLRGQVQLLGFPAIEIRLPFDPSDLDRGPTQWQLQFSGLIVPEIFIDAYRATGREEFYRAARDCLLAWARYEKRAWVNRGFLWNDHAVAARVRTLADFWSIYRQRADFQPEVAQVLWEFAARTGAHLAKPDQYTFATNHGVMQNIALWQLALAFPSLPRAEEYKQLAFSRLRAEITFYISPDGVVLEHSAGYHEFGLYLFGIALRYTTLLGLHPPLDWSRKYENARNFYLEIRRPDGSLPPFGDSVSGAGPAPRAVLLTKEDKRGRYGPLTAVNLGLATNPTMIYPVSGYAVVWDGLTHPRSDDDLSQTAFAWSYFPGHGHKHADELSVLLWSRGQEWWTSAGYWPYDDPDRVYAECWEGSDAPHLEGEKCASDRKASLLGSLSSDVVFAAEVEREGPGSLRIRRLLVHSEPSLWVIVDSCTTSSRDNLQTVWTMAPNVRLEASPESGGYTLSSDTSNRRLRSYFLGPGGMSVQTVRGSRNPFAGWVSFEGRTTATNSILTTQPAEGAWAVTVWAFEAFTGEQSESRRLPTVEWSNVQGWTVRVPWQNGSRVVSRNGNRISVESAGGASGHHISFGDSLVPPSLDVAAQVAELHGDYESEALRYPRFKDLNIYRIRATALGVILLFLQTVLFAIYRSRGGKHLLNLRVLGLIGWICLCIWVRVFYLGLT